ncbi:MAG: hypothetical protein C4K60_12435 [Ideonella sp. MAG2]|nr:MAG: hypothetical protein C4K60_12435 [Ideonella sp. MAG2]
MPDVEKALLQHLGRDFRLAPQQGAAHQLAVVVHVDDHIPTMAQQLVDHIIHTFGKDLIQSRQSVRFGMVAPAHRQAHCPELADRQLQKLRLHAMAPVPFIRGVKNVS